MDSLTPRGSLASTATDESGLATLRAGVALVNLNAKSHSETEIVAALSTGFDRTAASASATPHPPPLFPRQTAPAGVPTLAPTKSGYTRPTGQVPGKGLRMGVRGGLMGTGELKIPPSIQAKMAAVSRLLPNPAELQFHSRLSLIPPSSPDGFKIILHSLRSVRRQSSSLHTSQSVCAEFSSFLLWINESPDDGNGRRQGRCSRWRNEEEAARTDVERDERYCGWIIRVNVSLERRRDGWRSWIHATGRGWNAIQ